MTKPLTARQKQLKKARQSQERIMLANVLDFLGADTVRDEYDDMRRGLCERIKKVLGIR